MNRSIVRGLFLASASVLVLLGASLWHDQALWRTEDVVWVANYECETEVPGAIVPEFSFQVRNLHEDDAPPEGDEPIGRIAEHTFAVEMVGAVLDACGAPQRRVCRVIMIHDDYHRWRIHSAQLDGEAARVVDYVHVCDMENDMWLGLYD